MENLNTNNYFNSNEKLHQKIPKNPLNPGIDPSCDMIC